MAKKKEATKAVNKDKAEGEQLDLIDVHPENIKPIMAAARKYKMFQANRMAALDEEIKQKKVVLDLIHESGIKPLDGGKIKFEYEGTVISITPRDELVQIKEKGDSK